MYFLMLKIIHSEAGRIVVSDLSNSVPVPTSTALETTSVEVYDLVLLFNLYCVPAYTEVLSCQNKSLGSVLE